MHDPKPIYFPSRAAFRSWLERHHADALKLWVGFHKVVTGKPSMTWSESVDEALCFGWIDGIRKSVDKYRYVIRFTPRKPGSIWSRVNIDRAKTLIESGRMRPAGLKALEARKENKAGIYSYEQRGVDLPEPYGRQLKANKTAWAFFQAQPPSYRKVAFWWIVSAKKEETRQRRLANLVAHSVRGERLSEFNPRKLAR
jgi:uncharacterized protein YdeI (YjbR/CyaY-like superfamily)